MWQKFDFVLLWSKLWFSTLRNQLYRKNAAILSSDGSGLSDQKWFSILPILTLVTEMDFIHALLIISVKTVSHAESVPAAVANSVYRLAPRTIITSFIDMFCMYLVIMYNITATDSGVNFAMQSWGLEHIFYKKLNFSTYCKLPEVNFKHF